MEEGKLEEILENQRLLNIRQNERMQHYEDLAKNNPFMYKLQVVLFALLGYLYMLVVPICLALVAAFIVWVAIAFKLLVFLFKPLIFGVGAATVAYIKALFVKFPKPHGKELKRSEFPDLFFYLDGLSKSTGVKIHNVYLDAQMNASVAQYPLLGLFGLYRNHLHLGICLLLSLNEDELRSVLAHELGHLAGSHSKRRSWLYSMRMRWAQICQTLSNDQSLLLVPTGAFLSWYEPTFLTMTQVEARKHEREADQLATRIAGADAVARSFLSIEARGHLSENEVIENICRSYPLEKAPPTDIYNRISNTLCGPINDKRKMKTALEACLKSEASPFDTHPATKERIAVSDKVKEALSLPFEEQADKLEELFNLSSSVDNPAAPAIFGKQLQKALNLVNLEWQENAKDYWEQRYLKHSKAIETLQSLEESKKDAALSLKDRHKEVDAIKVLHGMDASLPLYLSIRQDFPDDVDTIFWLNVLSLRKDDELNEPEELERAARESKKLALDACLLLINHYNKKEDKEKVKELQELYEKHLEQNSEKYAERNSLQETDQFKPARINSDELESIVRELKKVKDLKSAYIVEKVLKIDAEEDRCFAIFIRFKVDYDSVMADDKLKASYEQSLQLINFNIPDTDCLCYIIRSPKSAFFKAAESIANAKIIG